MLFISSFFQHKNLKLGEWPGMDWESSIPANNYSCPGSTKEARAGVVKGVMEGWGWISVTQVSDWSLFLFSSVEVMEQRQSLPIVCEVHNGQWAPFTAAPSYYEWEVVWQNAQVPKQLHTESRCPPSCFITSRLFSQMQGYIGCFSP